MKIWIDFINTPQVSFWVPFIKELKKENNEFILTCRDSGNTIDLLEKNGFDFVIIGEKVGTGFFNNILVFLKRLLQLYFFIRKNKSDIAVSQSSFYQPIVAWILNINCLYTNDNEHAKGNFFGFLFAKKVILPEALNNKKFTKRWPLKSKISFYPSVKEAIYLSQQKEMFMKILNKKSVIYFRPEPWSAQYYNGPINFFDYTLISLVSEFKIIILPRDKKQIKHYQQKKFLDLSVVTQPLNLTDIISDCLLFIGAGGSMTREIAILGVPVVSIYQAEILCVDQYLIDKGKMNINPNITQNEIKTLLEIKLSNSTDFSLLLDGNISYKLLMDEIRKLNY
jgi:predicted glycosyltransferase